MCIASSIHHSEPNANKSHHLCVSVSNVDVMTHENFGTGSSFNLDGSLLRRRANN